MGKTYNYVYKIQFETGHVYYGVRSCFCKPELDPYLGSPYTHKNYWTEYEPKKTVLKEFDTREEALEAEKFLINWQWNSTNEGKLYSLNACLGGKNYMTAGVKPSAETVLKRSKPYKLWSPEGEVVEGMNLREFARSINADSANLAGVMTGRFLHYKGYTASFEAHKLYLEAVNTRGINDYSVNGFYRVSLYIDGKRKNKDFKELERAIEYRDYLLTQGHEFKVLVMNWKEKLQEVLS